MTTDQLRKLHQTRPFQPFEIHLADGSSLLVPHPEFMWITPGGRIAWVATGAGAEDGAAIVDLLLVTKLVTKNGSPPGENGRKKS